MYMVFLIPFLLITDAFIWLLVFVYSLTPHRRRYDVIIATNGKTFPYTTTPSTISWFTPLGSNDGFISYTLNRENLSLKLVYKDIVKISECDVFPKEILTEKVDELMKYFQSEYDNLRKNNKI